MILTDLPTKLRGLLKSNTVVIVTDSNVQPLYAPSLEKSFIEAGFTPRTFILPAGEASKTPENYLKLIDFMAQIPLTRSDCVVALGGGVVGDLAGFAAATYLRGIPIVQVPTTLLAAVDSSIGGKTGVNLPQGKNLLGAFHQPLLVCQDDALLDSLPPEVFLDGMGEVIKYAMIADEGLFSLLQAPNAMKTKRKEIVSRCGAIKHDFVQADEFDQGQRQILNFGHTIGHAIEKASHFSISHGRAIAAGMDMITRIAVIQGWCDEQTYSSLHSLLISYGFSLSLKALFPTHQAEGEQRALKEELLHLMASDKKRKGSMIDLIVPKKIGRCVIKQIPTAQLGELL